MGYADLIDEGDGSVEDIALRLVVVEGPTPSWTTGPPWISWSTVGRSPWPGILQGENDRLDFDMEVYRIRERRGNTVDIDFEMGIASRDFLIHGIGFGSGERIG